MKEIRITLRSDDFAAVSDSMIRLGVSFQVEPVAVEDAAPQNSSAAVPRREGKRKSARKSRQSGSKRAGNADRESSGADRLRAMVERNRLASGRPADDARQIDREPSETHDESTASGDGNT